MEAGLFQKTLFQVLPLRIFGIMQNDTLLAVPFFTFMGLILERSGMAEDLLETVGQVFSPLRGGLALATIFVGALLAATTGVMAAAMISMGLMLVGLYALFIVVLAIIRPSWVPALPEDALIYTEANGASGRRSLLTIIAIATATAFAWSFFHDG